MDSTDEANSSSLSAEVGVWELNWIEIVGRFESEGRGTYFKMSEEVIYHFVQKIKKWLL